MKSENVKIGPKLNETLWQDGIKNPPGKVKITVTKDDTDVVRAELDGVDYVDFKAQQKKADPSSLKEKIEAKFDGDNKKKPVKKEAKTETKAPKAEKKPEEKVETKTEKTSKVETKAPATTEKDINKSSTSKEETKKEESVKPAKTPEAKTE
jgi:hypothetical protein